MLRRGAGVLFLDSDVIVAANPYRAYGAPPLASFTMTLQGLLMGTKNVGVTRVQRAAPDGPVAWACADAADRQLRTAESMAHALARPWPPLSSASRVARHGAYMTWEQSVAGDSIMSAAWRTPVFIDSWSKHIGGGVCVPCWWGAGRGCARRAAAHNALFLARAPHLHT